MSMGQPPYPPGPDPYGQGGDPYGQSFDPYAQAADPYAQQQYYQQDYQQAGTPQYSAMPAPYPVAAGRPTNGQATAALILGVAGIATCGLTSIPAIFCGHIAQSQIKRTGEDGSGMAIAGLALGYLLTIGWIIYWVLIVGIMGLALWGVGNTPTGTY